GVPAHDGNTNAVTSIWYTWSLARDSDVIVDTAGSNAGALDTVIGVYIGNSVNSLTRVVSASSTTDNLITGPKQALVQFHATNGVAYHIAISGSRTNEMGLVRVRFELSGQPDTIPPIVQITSPTSGITVNTPKVTVSGTSFD